MKKAELECKWDQARIAISNNQGPYIVVYI